MERERILILGAAGRDFHNFNVVFREDPTRDVVAFTAQQIPHIANRRYPCVLAGHLYRAGIPIFPESQLEALIVRYRVNRCVMSYSAAPHARSLRARSGRRCNARVSARECHPWWPGAAEAGGRSILVGGVMDTVREIMESDVVTVSPEMTVRELARVLEDAGVSGVPVCDHVGNVIGVVSATDLVRLAAEDGDDVTDDELDDVEPEEDETETASWAYFMEEEPPPRFIDIESKHGPNLDDWTVRDIMTPAPHTVSPDTKLRDLARMLLRNQIHRALVVDDGVLTGIVTTLDVVRAVAGKKR